jgi:hypothetical protein
VNERCINTQFGHGFDSRQLHSIQKTTIRTSGCGFLFAPAAITQKSFRKFGLFLSILRVFWKSLRDIRFRHFSHLSTGFPQSPIGKSHPNSQLSNSRQTLLNRLSTGFSYVGKLLLLQPVDLPSPFRRTCGRILPHRYEMPVLAGKAPGTARLTEDFG